MTHMTHMTHFPIEGSIFYQTLYKQMRHGASCVMAPARRCAASNSHTIGVILHDRRGLWHGGLHRSSFGLRRASTTFCAI
jgi:hypothetical protein